MNISIGCCSLSKRFTKIFSTFGLLLFVTSNVGLAQVIESPDIFYELEKENWLEKIYAEQNTYTDTSFNAKFYHIDLEVSIASEFIKGNVTGLFESRINNLQSITLQLSSSFTIDSVTGNVSSYSFQNDLIELTLDNTYQQYEIVEIKIFYSGAPPVLNNTKGLRYETHGQGEPIIVTLSTPFLAHLWFPCKDGPGDKVDSAYIDITIPDTTINNIPLIATSNGVLEEVITQNDKKTFRWKERYPIVPYYLMIAISNYTHFQQIYLDSSGITFPIDYYTFKEDSAISQLGVEDLPEAISLFSNYFGPYPFHTEKYGMTQLGFYGAIENQTNTIQNNLSVSWFWITVHELAHMWFGDMITCENWHHGWLNEGFATYSEALWAEHIGGFNNYKSSMNSIKFWQGGTLYIEDISDPFGVFITIIYDKGAWLLHMLRGVVGDDLFFNILMEYTGDSRFRYDHASTEDFQEVCENVSGMDLEFFFDQWVYDEYYPIYNYGFANNMSDSSVTLTIEQIQSQNAWRSVFEMPIELQFNFLNGNDSVLTVWNDQQIQQYNFSFNREVVSIDFDPDEWILKKSYIVTDVSEENNTKLPNEYSIGQNFPNPFNPTTIIKYQIPGLTFVTIKVYDVLGNEIETLVNEEKSAGSYGVEFNASILPSGIYFYRLQAGSFVETKKMVLMK